MEYSLPSYFSLQYDSITEYEYIHGLIEQFEKTLQTDSYHIALFAYHLLFLAYYNQIIHKMNLWMENDYKMAVVSYGKERRELFWQAKNPTDYAHKKNSESGQFDLLHIFGTCDELVRECKNLVKFRNENLGHVNYSLVSQDECLEQIEKYDTAAESIHIITQDSLKKLIVSFAEEFDTTLELTRDILETDLIKPNWLSFREIEYLEKLCQNPDSPKTLEILRKSFGEY